MFAILIALFAVSAATAQDNNNAGGGGGWRDRLGDVWDKIKKIEIGSSPVCNNNLVSGGLIAKVFCTDFVPVEVTSKIGLDDGFGPGSPWCGGISCAFRALGCKEATYEIEAQIIRATGEEESCLERTGLDPQHCLTIAKYISKVPIMLEARKRAEFMSELKATPYEKQEVTPELMRQGKMLMRSFYADTAAKNNNFGLADDETWENHLAQRKRQGDIGGALLAEAQVCNPLIGTIVTAVATQFNLPFNITSLFGPCGTACEYAVCGLQLMCGGPDHLAADPILEYVQGQRNFECKHLEPADREMNCARWIDAPPDLCADKVCVASNGEFPEGYFSKDTNCPLPKTIHTPSRASMEDCCERCKDTCAINQVKCFPQKCNAPKWPVCAPITLGRYKPTSCCDTCIDPCEGVKCDAPPSSCPDGQVLGPRGLGDCCLACVDSPCAGISCRDAPRSQADCQPGRKFVEITQEAQDAVKTAKNPQCGDCCNKCVAGVGPDTSTEGNDASTRAVAALAAAVALVAAAF